MTPRSGRRLRWALPAGACVVTGGIIAGSLISAAQASPPLPPKTPAQLLAAVAGQPGPPPAFTGTVVETASLGLPDLPGQSDTASPESLLTGSHTVRVYYQDPQHLRLAVPGQLSETDLVRNGQNAWLWDSSQNQATQYQLPAKGAKDAKGAAGGSGATATPTPQKTPLTPQQAAQQVLAAVGPTTTVSVARDKTVAGESAYVLVLAPKDSRSLIGQVRIAIDGQRNVPLRVQVFARGAKSPAFQTGFQSVSFTKPAAANFNFTPPPHAKVVQGSTNSGSTPGEPNGHGSVVGSGWLAVAVLPPAALTAPGTGASTGPSTGASTGPSPAPSGQGGAAGNGPAESARAFQALQGAAKPVSGSWGTGRLLRTPLFSALFTSDGRVLVGAVTQDVLYSAASQAK
jgi:outer membrane lipoprotein-sorting protein